MLGEAIKDAKSFGWKTPEEKLDHDWTEMVTAIQNHIGSLNWGYRVSLRDKKVRQHLTRSDIIVLCFKENIKRHLCSHM